MASIKLFVPVFKIYSAAVGAHAFVQRWIYTVPAGKRAEITYMHTFLEDQNPQPIGTSFCVIKLTIGAVADNTLYIGTRGAIGDYWEAIGCSIPLDSADTVEAYTVNGAATVLTFRVQAIIKEFG